MKTNHPSLLSQQRLLLILLSYYCLCIPKAAAFAPSITTTTSVSSSTTTKKQQQQRSSNFELFGVKWDPSQTAQEAEEKVFVEFPTPAQRKTLRKEVGKLQARKELATFSMPEDGAGVREVTNDDDSLFETGILKQIWDLLEEGEIEVIQIRGLSRSDKKYAHAAAEHLCYEMEEYYYSTVVMGGKDDDDDDDDDQDEEEVDVLAPREVTLLSSKGHSAILYCPTMLELDHPNKIVLRTSVGQKNTWKPREKAPRDDRGQIIPIELRDEYYKQQEEQ
jgi:hypothetical protein